MAAETPAAGEIPHYSNLTYEFLATWLQARFQDEVTSDNQESIRQSSGEF